VSCSRKACDPESSAPPAAFVCATDSSRISDPDASVRRKVASSARAYADRRSYSSATTG